MRNGHDNQVVMQPSGHDNQVVMTTMWSWQPSVQIHSM